MDQHFDSIIPDGNPEGNNTNELIDLERTKERFKNFYNNCQEFFDQSIRIFGVVGPLIRGKTKTNSPMISLNRDRPYAISKKNSTVQTNFL